MKKDVFISYKSTEADVAKKVKHALEEGGVRCWMAPDDIQELKYTVAIPRGIKECRIFLLLLSQSAQESQWVESELDTAITYKKEIIPFMISKCKLNESFEFMLRTRQIMFAYENIKESMEVLVKKIQKIVVNEQRPSIAGGEDKVEEKVTKRVLPYEGKEKYIFLSYAHENSKTVMPIIERLQQEGYRVWYDDGMEPGSQWTQDIVNHLAECSYFVAFISREYLKSSFCKDELEFAHMKGKKRLLIYLEEFDLPIEMQMRLCRIQNIHMNNYYDTEDFLNKFFRALGNNEYN